MEILDVFDDDAFKASTLSVRISRVPHVPGRIGQLGIFQTTGIRTTDATIEEQNGTLALIPYTDRNAPDNVVNPGKRRRHKIETGHFPLKRIIRPDEIQNVSGMNNALEDDETNDLVDNAMEVVDDKANEMIPYHDATLEFQRLGALKGYILDSDGSTVVEDLYQRFQLQPQTQSFALNNTNTEVRLICFAVKRTIEAALGGSTYLTIRALCGAGFFDALISHPEVKEAFKRYTENGQVGEMLRNDPRFRGFEYGGIFWEEYRGQVGNVDFIAEDECQIFPTGVPNMYVTHFAPANMIEFVNTKGLPRYMSIERLPHGRGVEVLTESNSLSINTRPNATVKGTVA